MLSSRQVGTLIFLGEKVRLGGKYIVSFLTFLCHSLRPFPMPWPLYYVFLFTLVLWCVSLNALKSELGSFQMGRPEFQVVANATPVLSDLMLLLLLLLR